MEQNKYYHTIQDEINKVYKGLYDALHKCYIGDGLYVDIDEFIINDPIYLPETTAKMIPEDDRRLLYMISGTYGRQDDQGDPIFNFQFPFKLWCAAEDSSDFIGGLFYRQIEQDDYGEVIFSEEEIDG